MKNVYRLIIGIVAAISLTAQADTYQPIISCEGGRVIVDKVQAPDANYNHVQLVVHGTDFAQYVLGVFQGYGMLYRNGQQVFDNSGGDTAVFRFQTNELNSNFPESSRFNALKLQGSELKVNRKYCGEGVCRQGEIYFKGCHLL